MAKQSKRTRKFIASGGVQSRLQKGTITKKGQNVLKRKKRGGAGGANGDDDALIKRSTTGGSTSSSYGQEQRQKKNDSDLLSARNLGELDMESFFESVAEDATARSDDDDDSLASQKNDSSSNEGEAKGSKLTRAGDDGSDSDSDEDVDEAERQMKKVMGKLKSQDPDFHQFLQENEESLLDFGGGNESDEDSDDGEAAAEIKVDDRDEDEEGNEDTIETPDGLIPLTNKLLLKVERGAFKSHGLKALKKITNAFRSACHLADADKSSTESRVMYSFESSAVFDRLMVVALTKCADEFHYHLLGKGASVAARGDKSKSEHSDRGDEDEFDPNKPINPKTLEKSPRWESMKPILFTYLKSAMHILAEAKDPALVTFVLKALSNYIVYLTPFPRLAEAMLKTLTNLWSAPIDSSEDYQVVRLHSFLRIRQLAITQPFPFIEACLKKVYLAYAQRAKFATGSTVMSALPTLTFMGNCVVELYSLDYHSSYQHAFIYIRQLALHLRTAMQKKTHEAMSAVYCWQYMHCLKLWVAVLTEACRMDDDSSLSSGEDQLLRSLIFPMSQIILGTARLIPSTRYLPLRMHCVRLLQQLAAAAEVFLPTTSILLEVFDLHELSQPMKKATKNNVQQMSLTLRLGADNPLRTMEESEMCISEVFLLLNRELDLYHYSAAFPEFSVRITQRLRKVRG